MLHETSLSAEKTIPAIPPQNRKLLQYWIMPSRVTKMSHFFLIFIVIGISLHYRNVFSAPGSPVQLQKAGHILMPSKIIVSSKHVEVAEILL